MVIPAIHQRSLKDRQPIRMVLLSLFNETLLLYNAVRQEHNIATRLHLRKDRKGLMQLARVLLSTVAIHPHSQQAAILMAPLLPYSQRNLSGRIGPRICLGDRLKAKTGSCSAICTIVRCEQSITRLPCESGIVEINTEIVFRHCCDLFLQYVFEPLVTVAEEREDPLSSFCEQESSIDD